MSQVPAVRLNITPEDLENSQTTSPVVVAVQEYWKQCLSLIEEELPAPTIQTWFHPITPVSFTENTLILRLSSRFFLEWIEGNYGHILRKSVSKTFGENARVEFLIATSANEAPEPLPATEEEKDETPPTGAGAVSIKISCDIDHRFTFENFFTGPENEFAPKAAQHVAKNLGKADFNPLVIHGTVGAGKSHLLHALGNYVQENCPDKRLTFIGSESFVYEYIYALQNNRINKFTASLMSAEVFLFDDIQTLFNKTKTQEGIFFVISELVKKGAQVAITSDVPPNQLRDFNPRLVSFLQTGLIVDAPPGEYATREKFIRHHLDKNGVQLNEKVIHFLADTLGANIHHLYSVMVRIVAQISLLGKSLSLNDVRFIISQICPQEGAEGGSAYSRNEVGIDEIVNAVSTFYGVPIDILFGVSRKKKVMEARQIAIYLCRELTGESLSSIGYHFSKLHHSSVLYSYNKIGQALLRNAKLKSEIQKVKALL